MVNPVKDARDALIAQLRVLDAVIDQKQFERTQTKSAIESLNAILHGVPVPGGSPPDGGEPRRRARIKPALMEILGENNGRPMHADEVYAELQRRQVEVTAKNPVNSVGTALGRLVDEGLVEKVDRNKFRWVGGADSAEASADSDGQVPANGHAVNGAPVLSVPGPSAW